MFKIASMVVAQAFEITFLKEQTQHLPFCLIF
jgi:hypothetical protein